MSINQFIEDRIEYWRGYLKDADKDLRLDAMAKLEELKLIQNQLKERE